MNQKVKDCYNDILMQLDNAVENYDFPIFNNLNYPAAAMKIHTFRDSSEWIIAFERIVYGVSEGSFLNLISAFGNKLYKKGLQSDIEIISPTDEYPIWDQDYNYILDENKFCINIRGERLNIEFTEEDYEKSFVNKNTDMDPGLRMLRVLVYKVDNKIWFTDSEILEKCHRVNIPVFLKLEKWNHPDVIGSNEMPSNNNCFKSLALALASGDPSFYNCNEKINSFWYYWDIDY